MESPLTSPGTPKANAKRSIRSRYGRYIAILIAAVVLTAVLAVSGRGFLAWWTRQMAARQLGAGALSTAEQWLAWSAWLDSSDGRTALLRATCLRRRYRQGDWNAAMDLAERLGAPAEAIEHERQLGLIQAGRMSDDEDELPALIESGVSPHDACAAFVHGYLARKDPARAAMVLDAWAADHPQEAHVAAMRGVYWLWLGDSVGDVAQRYHCRDRAETEFRNALLREPRHEMARQALADMLEEDDRLEDALIQYATLAADFPANEAAQLGVARILRGLGAVDRARMAMESPPARHEASAGAAAEIGQIEFESGGYAAAREWLRRVDLDRTDNVDALRAAAIALAVEGKTTGAERLFARLDREHGEWARSEELLVRLATGPPDPQAAAELDRLTAPKANLPASEPLGDSPAAASAFDLYVEHCGGCHGPAGDGNGRGARHLYPKPRDFRSGKFRLVSTVNGVASLGDVIAVVRRGMPGTAMRAYDELTDSEHAVLAEEVLRLHREGLREQLFNEARSEGDEIDADEIDEAVESCATGGEAVSVPPIGPADPKAVGRGRDLYFALGCQNCHGDDGKGAWNTPHYDEQGLPAVPRDLVYDPFKGGPEPESIYLRLFLGMPGTPHPAAGNVPENQLVDLVHYCRSLSREPKRAMTNHQRAVEAARRPSLWAFDGLHAAIYAQIRSRSSVQPRRKGSAETVFGP